MVLAGLESSICDAIEKLIHAAVLDKKAILSFSNEISAALLRADVEKSIVFKMIADIRKIITVDDLSARPDEFERRSIILKAVYDGLFSILDPKKELAIIPEKGQSLVVLVLGLEGAGKSAACIKYARHYQKKGWNPALIFADNYNAADFSQLCHIATEAEIPFHPKHHVSRYRARDAWQIADDGAKNFKKNCHDLIIIDGNAVKAPEVCGKTNARLLLFVVDSHVGNAILISKEFNGGVIITKMNDHSKEGGCLTALAAQNFPVVFIETGEHVDEFKSFDVKSFVSGLLGRSYWFDVIKKFEKLSPKDELAGHLRKTNFTLRNMQEQFLKICEPGFIQQVGQMLLKHPEFHKKMLPEEDYIKSKMVRSLAILASMSNEELDSIDPANLINEDRMKEIADDADCRTEDVRNMLEHYKLVSSSRNLRS